MESALRGAWPPVAVAGLLLAGLLLRYAVSVAWGGESDPGGYLKELCAFDCNWYLSIVTGGYDDAGALQVRGGVANWAFFPLYPSLVWMLTTLTGLPALVSGFVLSNAFAFAAALASRPLFGDQQRAWWLFVITLLAGPFSFLFSTLYSEGLFILLTILAVVALQRSDYLAAAVIGALLSASRPTGVLFVFAILTQMLVDHHRAGGSWRSFPARLLGDPKLLVPLLLAPLGLFAYMAFLYLHVGDALAFAHIQRSWGRDLGNPLTTFADALGNAFADLRLTVDDAWTWAAVIGFALSGALFARGRHAAAVFCLLCLAASLSAGVMSMGRFVAGLAPLGVVAAELLTSWRYVAVPAAVLLGLALAIGWMNGSYIML